MTEISNKYLVAVAIIPNFDSINLKLKPLPFINHINSVSPYFPRPRGKFQIRYVYTFDLYDYFPSYSILYNSDVGTQIHHILLKKIHRLIFGLKFARLRFFVSRIILIHHCPQSLSQLMTAMTSFHSAILIIYDRNPLNKPNIYRVCAMY